jgi:hypothetical protein
MYILIVVSSIGDSEVQPENRKWAQPGLILDHWLKINQEELNFGRTHQTPFKDGM